MGQYYKAVVLGEDGTVYWVNPHDYGSGFKLMEHSWMTNQFVDSVASLIWKIPRRVAWVGDYSDSRDGSAYEANIPDMVYMSIYEDVWGDDANQHRARPEKLMAIDGAKFLVDHTSKSYVDLDAYAKANGFHEEWMGLDAEWVVHPLPLLTACWNGRGGGDYHSSNPDYDKVGIWAFHTLEMTDELPDGYEPVSFGFKEV